MLKRISLLMLVGVMMFGSLTSVNAKTPSGELVVYHAGSLSVPFKAIKADFEQLNPGVNIKLVSGGSTKIARMVTEGDAVDILASADYKVIDNLLIPDYAKWNALFANNSMVVVYTDESKYADQITSSNWYEILLRDGVNYGHSEPDLDPCGYRTVLLWQLAEQYYQKEGLFDKLTIGCPAEHITQKADQLFTLLGKGDLDYVFEYESVARQNAAKNPAFKYIKLPAEINLSSIKHAGFYHSASIDLTGSNPGETITTYGEPIVYSLTMPKTGKNPELAVEFLKYFFTEGIRTLDEQGQPTMKIQIQGAEYLPAELQSVL